MKNMIRGLLCFLCAALLIACSSAETDWNQAQNEGTAAAYQAFLTKYPNSPHDAVARQRVQTIQDNSAWMTAESTNTLASYQQYIAAEPNGAYVKDARSQVATLQATAAWQSAKSAGTAMALQDFLQKYPNATQAQDAHTMLMKYNYQVQLGRYRSSKEADMVKTRLEGKYGKDLQAVVVVPPSGRSRIYSVASAQMTEEQAKTACMMLRKSHQRCEVMKHEPAAH